MKITVIGLGYVGIVAASCLANRGHHVVGVDLDCERVDALESGRLPIYEPGLAQMMTTATRSEFLRFYHTADFPGPLGEAALVTVGTPQSPDGAADLRQVHAAVSWVSKRTCGETTLVMKSTVPPGTGERLAKRDLAGSGVRYVSNPEFLREGQAVHDWKHPDRVVVGMEPGDTQSLEATRAIQGSNDAPQIVTDITTAEMIKYASNAFLATRISFINEMAALCERVGASIDTVSEGLAMDPRTGSKIHAGVGYGGSCFPKDVRALDHLALASDASVDLLRSVIRVNNRQRLRPLHALRERFNGGIPGLRVAVLGLAFKPDTDDVREAPALDLIRALTDDGATVSAYDPHARDKARRHLPASVTLADDPTAATQGAQAVVLMTEWEQIVGADWETIGGGMLEPRFLFDGRNALDPAVMEQLGFEYRGVGRNAPTDCRWQTERRPVRSANARRA